MKKTPRRALPAGHFYALLQNIDEEKETMIVLPFAPFPGLWLQIPWRGGDFGKVEDVYWSANQKRFDLFIEEEVK